MSHDNEEWPSIESSSFVLFGGTCQVVKNISSLMMIVSEEIIRWDHSCFDEHPIHAEECHAVRVPCIIIYRSEHVSMLHNIYTVSRSSQNEPAKSCWNDLLSVCLSISEEMKGCSPSLIWVFNCFCTFWTCQACGIISHHGKGCFKNHMPDEVQ